RSARARAASAAELDRDDKKGLQMQALSFGSRRRELRRSRTNRDLVLDALHAVDVASDALGGAALFLVLREARQHHRTVERLDLDRGRVDILVVEEAALDGG